MCVHVTLRTYEGPAEGTSMQGECLTAPMLQQELGLCIGLLAVQHCSKAHLSAVALLRQVPGQLIFPCSAGDHTWDVYMLSKHFS